MNEEEKYLYEEDMLLRPFHYARREYEDGTPIKEIKSKYGKDVESYVLAIVNNPKQKK